MKNNPLNLPPLSPPLRLLFGPGPSNIDPRILHALGSPLVGHLDPYFVELMGNIQTLLKWVWQTENEVTLAISGTGSAAMEATIANLVEPGDVVVVGTNGYFGKRLADIARRYGAVVHEIVKPWGETYSMDEIREYLDIHKPKVLGLVHGETSTGTIQNIEGVGDLCHEYNCLLLLDTVTTMGGAPIYIDKWGVDASYSCSQKCLGCTSGLSPITFSPRAMEVINNRSTPISSFYFDINLLAQYWKGKLYHHTAPISLNYGLYEALLIIYEEGLEERWERHSRVGKFVAESIEEMGLSLKISNPEDRLPQLTTVIVPEGIEAITIIKSLRDKYNIDIAGGLGELAGKIWRIGFMGYNATEENVTMVLTSLKDVLSHKL
jgi:alanine-glyoxylate transaminase/serine-glyoxylate transaminase/serine-pyruvate transaminase